MKHKTVLLLFIILICACHSTVKDSIVLKKGLRLTFFANKNYEFIPFKSVKLNGNIPVISNFRIVVSKLGPPDSIIEFPQSILISNFSKNSKYCFFKGLQFEKNNDILVLRKIVFSKNNFLLTDKIRLSETTTIGDFKKVFPRAAANELSGTSLDKYQYINVATSPNKNKNEWNFTFNRNTGKLISLLYWINNKK